MSELYILLFIAIMIFIYGIFNKNNDDEYED